MIRHMVNGALIAVVLMQFIQPGFSIPESDDLATAYIRDYCIALGQLDGFADEVANSDKSSAALAKEWNEKTTSVRLKASKPMDTQIVEMLEQGKTRDDFAALIRRSCERWRQIGEAL